MPHGASLFDALVGDTATCLRLAEAFYTRVRRDPVLRPFFPGKTARCAIEQLAAFLVQLLGGPAEDTQARWWLSLRDSHQRFQIGPRERDAWMRHMIAALDDVSIDDSARQVLRRFFEHASTYIVNSGDVAVASVATATAVRATADAPYESAAVAAASSAVGVPSSDRDLGAELSCCWHAQRSIDDLVSAIRGGDAVRAIALGEQPILRSYLAGRPAVFAALLGAMIGGGDERLREYVRHQVAQAPTLAREHFSGRTLLHAAAIAGDVTLVQSLLDCGADVMAGIHSPLYAVGNECTAPGGADVVRTLVRAGAVVDAAEGPKRCTALHMAARRGNVEIATALLDCGADIEARDSAGVTPLRRAVNCRKPTVAALLRARGAC